MSTYTEVPLSFASLLHDIGKDLDDDRVRYIKYLLQGHINKETLQHLGDSGLDVVEILQKRGLVSEKRLAFLRKLLVEVKCLKLVNLLDDFKEKSSPGVNFGDDLEKGRKGKRNEKREALLRMMDRLENEIKSIEDNEVDSSDEVKQFEAQMQTLNQRLVTEEDEIAKLKQQIKENQSRIESFERKLESIRFFLKKHEVELDKIKQKLDENKNSASIKMELKEKMKEYETEKRGEDDLVSKYQSTLDEIRSIHVEIRHRTEEIIKLEDCIQDLVLQIRIVKHTMHKNHRIKMELQEKLDNTSADLADTDRQKPVTPGWVSRSRSRLTARSFSRAESGVQPDDPLEYEVLEYDQLSGKESVVIGRKGKGISPPQFNLPVNVAVDLLGTLHVADYGNSRVHVIATFEGATERQPLNIGGKCRPCGLAINYRGDIVMTDSQIIRVFNNKGEFIRPILPVYGKNDRRPHLCSLAVDSNGCIYAGDRANHRIQRFSADGKFMHFIGSHEEISYPIGVAVTKNGDIIVSDYTKHILKVFHREESLKPKTIGNQGLGACKFSYPRGIALDSDENILVADSQNHRIQIVTLDGEYVGSFGRIGDDAGCLNTPYDITVDNNGSVIVADTKNHRVQVFIRVVPIYSMNNSENKLEMSDEKNDCRAEGTENGEVNDEDYDASGSEEGGSRLNTADKSQTKEDETEKQNIPDKKEVIEDNSESYNVTNNGEIAVSLTN